MILCMCNYITIITITIYNYECMRLCMCIVWNNMEWHVDNIAFLPVEVSMNWAMGPNMPWIEPSSQPEMIPGFKGIRSQMACIIWTYLKIYRYNLGLRIPNSQKPSARAFSTWHWSGSFPLCALWLPSKGFEGHLNTKKQQEKKGSVTWINIGQAWENMGKPHFFNWSSLTPVTAWLVHSIEKILPHQDLPT
jgi:hypothetical protein